MSTAASAGAVVVTGAARGIGAAIAQRFAADGYVVVGARPVARGGVGSAGGAVHFLCSPRSSYITGVVLPVDGGWLANGLPAEAG